MKKRTRWKPPLTAKGKPCTRCVGLGKECHLHRPGGNVGRPTDLTPLVLKEAQSIEATTIGALADALGRPYWTVYEWWDKGKADIQRGEDTVYSQFTQLVLRQRRRVASKLMDAALDGALGHKVMVKDPKTGKPVGIYETSPDARLAMQLAGRLDPEQLPKEGLELEHSGTVETEHVVTVEDVLAAAIEAKKSAKAE